MPYDHKTMKQEFFRTVMRMCTLIAKQTGQRSHEVKDELINAIRTKENHRERVQMENGGAL